MGFTQRLIGPVAAAAFSIGAAVGRADDPRPLRQQPYAGISMRDNGGAEGTVIGWVLPGPFGGTGFESPSVKRGDILVSANGKKVDAAGFKALLETLNPGDELTVVVKRGPKTDSNGAVPRGDPAGEEQTFTVKLDSRERWTGTLRGRGALVNLAEVIAPVGEMETRILAVADELVVRQDEGDTKRLDSLLGYLRDVRRYSGDVNALRRMCEAFERPLSLDGVEEALAVRVRTVAAGARPKDIADLLSSAREPAIHDTGTVCDPTILNNKPAGATALVRRLRDDVSINSADADKLLSVINVAPDMAWMRRALIDLVQNESVAREPQPGESVIPADLPDTLRAAVKGDVKLIRVVKDGRGKRLVVIGGDGPNEYDMRYIDTVYDTGGDDHYVFGVLPGEEYGRHHWILDESGNDVYESTADFAGPGVAVYGTSVIEDLSGDDVYRSTGQFSIAAGLFGVGIIIDRAGNDRYENTGPNSGWSEGVGFYGAGLIVDLKGNDTYLGEKLCQGVGGPAGFGAIIDAEGNDSYKANGPDFKSAYDTPGVFLSMSQGFGYGIRGYASGGIGAIYDLSGNDHYDAGEFSQGCGYSFAFGILHDFAGDDVYDGNRYSQGASAHQAIGMLIDDAGNDQYKGMTAASQGAAWDQSIAMLIDRAGDDVYKADGLSQGAAAQQALAVLIDLSGKDRYEAAGGEGPGVSVQGCSGGNEYHYDADKMFSFSVLMDLGGAGKTEDWFSTGRKGKVATGVRGEKGAGMFGVFVHE